MGKVVGVAVVSLFLVTGFWLVVYIYSMVCGGGVVLYDGVGRGRS